VAGPAPIYSLATDDHGRAEAAAWARFSSARDAAEFCASWLAILCAQLGRTNGALLLVGPERDGAFRPAAAWPDATRNLQYLVPAAEKALTERRGVVLPREAGSLVGYPIEVSGTLRGAVALDLAGGEPALQQALRLVYWASAWLVDQFRQQDLRERDAQLARLALAADLVATALQERRYASSALAVANELAARLSCDRVSIGVEAASGIDVRAISHTASFDPKTNLVRLIGEAMHEVLDAETAIVHPGGEGEELAALAHAELARELKDAAVLSVPLLEDGHAAGVLTLERARGEPFDAQSVELCKTVGMLLGPILELKRQSERSEWQRLREALSGGARALFGPRHPGLKLLASLGVIAALFLALASGEYRVAAKTVIEGEVQRAVVAPFDGYVVESRARAGDNVAKGQLVARLDERDLRLERTRLESEREQLLGKHRQALATLDRATMAAVAAQISQTDAQLSLVEDRLGRAALVAPFDGVVVSGDLSQMLGTPVEQGKVLFQIAPLSAYRVILEVDERDIAQLRVGQKGELALSGIPDQALRFAVKQITPVSTAQDGRNYFRVEAQLDDASARLRPGMEGVGKVAVGERKLFWIWTHPLLDWLRLWLWRWLP
jgi:multidrug resistance efflux pump